MFRSLEYQTFCYSGYAGRSAPSQIHSAAKGRYLLRPSQSATDCNGLMGPLPQMTVQNLFCMGVEWRQLSRHRLSKIYICTSAPVSKTKMPLTENACFRCQGRTAHTIRGATLFHRRAMRLYGIPTYPRRLTCAIRCEILGKTAAVQAFAPHPPRSICQSVSHPHPSAAGSLCRPE